MSLWAPQRLLQRAAVLLLEAKKFAGRSTGCQSFFLHGNLGTKPSFLGDATWMILHFMKEVCIFSARKHRASMICPQITWSQAFGKCARFNEHRGFDTRLQLATDHQIGFWQHSLSLQNCHAESYSRKHLQCPALQKFQFSIHQIASPPTITALQS